MPEPQDPRRRLPPTARRDVRNAARAPPAHSNTLPLLVASPQSRAQSGPAQYALHHLSDGRPAAHPPHRRAQPPWRRDRRASVSAGGDDPRGISAVLTTVVAAGEQRRWTCGLHASSLERGPPSTPDAVGPQDCGSRGRARLRPTRCSLAHQTWTGWSANRQRSAPPVCCSKAALWSVSARAPVGRCVRFPHVRRRARDQRFWGGGTTASGAHPAVGGAVTVLRDGARTTRAGHVPSFISSSSGGLRDSNARDASTAHCLSLTVRRQTRGQISPRRRASAVKTGPSGAARP